MKDVIARLTSWKSTVMAVITGLLTVGVALKIVGDDALTAGIAATGNLYEAVIALLGSVLAIIQLFAKDAPAPEVPAE
jgi:hypothetical protein